MEFEDGDAEGLPRKNHRGHSCWSCWGAFAALAILVAAGVFYRNSSQHQQQFGGAITVIDRGIRSIPDLQLKGELESVRRKIRQKQQSIWDEWDVSSFPLFLATMDIPVLSWEIQKHKFIILILKRRANFIVGFSGSSITAGHDSFFNESFPLVFYDDMKELMKSLNISFEVLCYSIFFFPIVTEIGTQSWTWE